MTKIFSPLLKRRSRVRMMKENLSLMDIPLKGEDYSKELSRVSKI